MNAFRVEDVHRDVMGVEHAADQLIEFGIVRGEFLGGLHLDVALEAFTVVRPGESETPTPPEPDPFRRRPSR